MNYLLDTNTVVYYVNKVLPVGAANLIKTFVPNVSFVTRIELFAWQGLQPDEQLKIETLLKAATIFSCEEAIIFQTIAVRKQYRLKLPDAMIAATALVHNLTLLSRNLKDFKNIPGLTVIDPYTL